MSSVSPSAFNLITPEVFPKNLCHKDVQVYVHPLCSVSFHCPNVSQALLSPSFVPESLISTVLSQTLVSVMSVSCELESK